MARRQLSFLCKRGLLSHTSVEAHTRDASISIRSLAGTLRGHYRGYSSDFVKKINVGFIGLGNMGSPMAINLLKSGHQLTVFDIKRDAAENQALHGARCASSILELSSSANTIITMLPSPSSVLDAYLGDTGILAGLAQNPGPCLLIDASTVDPQTCKTLAAEVASATVASGAAPSDARSPPLTLLDAPVSGGVTGAQAGTLTFMVGGTEEGFRKAAALFSAMGSRSIYCGPSGSGAVAKLCNNLALAIQMAGISEALALGQRLGMDPSLLSTIFNASTAKCWSSECYNPAPGVMSGIPAARDYQGGFSNMLMVKDLSLVTRAARHSAAMVPLSESVLAMYQELSSHHPNEDFSSIYKYLYKGMPSMHET